MGHTSIAKRIRLSNDQCDLLRDRSRLPSAIVVNRKSYTLEMPSGTGFKGVVWKVRDEHGRARALKLCVYDDYTERSFLEEASRAALLDTYSVFADFVDADVVEVEVAGGERQRFVAFVEEWVDGHTLREFLEREVQSVSTAFFLAYVRGVAEGFSALRTVGLVHDDFHPDNVMLARPAPGALSEEWSVKIIDTGSLKPVNSATRKEKDDHRHLVDHLVDIWNAIFRRRHLTVRDRRFLDEARRLLRSMLDDDPSIALRDPGQIVRHFALAHSRSAAPASGQVVTPTSPFEFISAEHIADDRLLVEIFARSCPFLDKVDGPDPCLVTGPRGCGKSTIFRWLSLKAHLHKPAFDPDQFRIAGFYLSCSSDLQNKLSWIRSGRLARRFRREIVHYFNLLLAREVLHTLSLIARRGDRVTMWGFGEVEEEVIWRFVLESLGQTSRPRLQGVTRLDQAIDLVERDLFASHAQMAKRESVTSCTAEGFLGDLTDRLMRHVSYFARKRIAFLVDDFSAHRIHPGFRRCLIR